MRLPRVAFPGVICTTTVVLAMFLLCNLKSESCYIHAPRDRTPTPYNQVCSCLE